MTDHNSETGNQGSTFYIKRHEKRMSNDRFRENGGKKFLNKLESEIRELDWFLSKEIVRKSFANVWRNSGESIKQYEDKWEGFI